MWKPASRRICGEVLREALLCSLVGSETAQTVVVSRGLHRFYSWDSRRIREVSVVFVKGAVFGVFLRALHLLALQGHACSHSRQWKCPPASRSYLEPSTDTAPVCGAGLSSHFPFLYLSSSSVLSLFLSAHGVLAVWGADKAPFTFFFLIEKKKSTFFFLLLFFLLSFYFFFKLL